MPAIVLGMGKNEGCIKTMMLVYLYKAAENVFVYFPFRQMESQCGKDR